MQHSLHILVWILDPFTFPSVNERPEVCSIPCATLMQQLHNYIEMLSAMHDLSIFRSLHENGIMLYGEKDKLQLPLYVEIEEADSRLLWEFK